MKPCEVCGKPAKVKYCGDKCRDSVLKPKKASVPKKIAQCSDCGNDFHQKKRTMKRCPGCTKIWDKVRKTKIGIGVYRVCACGNPYITKPGKISHCSSKCRDKGQVFRVNPALK